ncbi:maestro heat-like repeat-containing protein family member 9 [Petaurus breviceps papuanus]|uniref:maestro heat-like repeat-containing protein family member 9 n=1 Tax=Petaurus breviceps papuanus TaxID=3040969 RepID=UPI0036D8816B
MSTESNWGEFKVITLISIKCNLELYSWNSLAPTECKLPESKDHLACMYLRPSTQHHFWHMEKINTDVWDIFCKLLSHQTMILAINSSYVDPLEQFDTQLKTAEECFKNVFSMPDIETLKERQMNPDDLEDIEQLYQTILTTFEDTLLILVSKDLYKLQLLMEMIIWMNRETHYLQERVMNIISRVLKYSSRKIKGCTSIDAPCMGQLAAELAILCNHENLPIVIQSSLAMYYLLCIVKYQNEDLCTYVMMDLQAPEKYKCFNPLENDFVPTMFQRNNAAIAMYVGKYLPSYLLNDFVYGLLKKICNSPLKTAKKAATLLKLVLEDHGFKVTRAAHIVDYIHNQLTIESPNTPRQALLQMVTLLTRSCPQKVVFQLLDYMFPVDSSVLEMWKAVSSEPDSSSLVMKTILTVLKGKPGEVEGSRTPKRFSLDDTNMMPVTVSLMSIISKVCRVTSSNAPLMTTTKESAAQALCILLSVPEYKKAADQFFPELLIALILQLHYNSEMKPLLLYQRVVFAQEALRLLLRSSGLQQVDNALQKKDCWNHFSNTIFHHYGVYIIAKTLSEYNFTQFPETLQYLYKLSLEGPRRTEDSVTTVIFLIELLNNFFKDPFPEEFLALFRTWVNDPNPTVSKLSLQKIASMSTVINKVSNAKELILCIVDSFSSKYKTVIIQALITLRKLLSGLEKVMYSFLCVRIASSYHFLMDHVSEASTSMAIRHFGELLKEMNQYSWMLKPAVVKAVVPLILFLEDTEIKVVQACKYTLNICAPYFKCETLPLLQDEFYHYEIVVLSICNCLFNNYGIYISEVVYTTLGFLKHCSSYLRKAAVILTGYLAKLGSNLLLCDEIEVMLKAMEKVLRDRDPSIRQMADFTYMLFLKVAKEVKDSRLKRYLRRVFTSYQFKNMMLLYNYRGREAAEYYKHINEDTLECMENKSIDYSESLLELSNTNIT